jgi:UDP-N-acetylglucosamine 4,6-dehydratase
MKNNFFLNKKILVTGGSGSIGSGIVKTLMKKKCKVIRVLSNDENGIYELSEEITSINKKLKLKMEDNKIRFLLGDIRDYKRCLLATQDVDIIVHAAALKHVPICEYNKEEAYKTNVLGTKNLIKSSIKNKVKFFLFISTDKAAEPTSSMGKSKLQAEKLIIKANKNKNNTKFSVIRFGNILLSRGSVVYKFLKQIKDKENITVTGKSVSRFFISIKKAVERISEAFQLMQGGEVFVVINMSSFKIIDLAKAIRSILGKKNRIKIIGLREGEKKYEKLVSDYENIQPHPTSNSLGLIKNKKNKLNNSQLQKQFTDSRYARHLNIEHIKRIILKEKLF